MRGAPRFAPFREAVVNRSRMPASIALAAAVPCSGRTADRMAAPRRDEVQGLRHEVHALRLELRELKRTLAARPGGGDKPDALSAVK
jgi:hypothetical protein